MVRRDGGLLVVEGIGDGAEITRRLAAHNLFVNELTPMRADLESVFLELTAEEVVFVGDQPVLDVLGARRAGMWMVQIGDLAPAGAEPHARIDALSELLPALRALALID